MTGTNQASGRRMIIGRATSREYQHMSGRLSALPSYILVVWRALPSYRLVVYGSNVAGMDSLREGCVPCVLVTTEFSQGSLL